MDETWQLLPTADDEERHVWQGAAALEEMAREPAAPPNRLRRVWRVVSTSGRVWFAKEFVATPFGHRVRNRTTAPRCDLDAEREAFAALELLARGFEVARPVAIRRRRDGASFYVCANLGPGRSSLADRLRERGFDPHAWRAAVAVGERLLRAGVHWPDLSADHIWLALGEDEGGRTDAGIALLDLHDVTVRAAGSRLPRRARAMRRMLRRALRSLRGLDVPARAKLAAGVRLLRTAGIERSRRRGILARLAAVDAPSGSASTSTRTDDPLREISHVRYDDERAARYRRSRPKRRSEAEERLLAAVWPGDLRRGALVLDAPCGAGRLRPFVEARGAAYRGIDRSRSMLLEAAGQGAAGGDAAEAAPSLSALAEADLLHLPFPDRSMDAVICFRFLHHVPRDLAASVVAELCRVARTAVVVSHFHPISLHHARRVLRRVVSGRPQTRFAIGGGRLDRMFAAAGFRPVVRRAQSAYLRDLWVVRYERTAPES
jgi:SAM-dependent methyltransferase